MMAAACVLFALTAGGGVILAGLHLRGKEMPMALALGHGFLGAVGILALLGLLSRAESSALMMLSLILFLLAGAVGVALFSIHLRSRPLPRPLLGVHAAAAGAAFLLLLVRVLTAR